MINKQGTYCLYSKNGELKKLKEENVCNVVTGKVKCTVMKL